jgi:hypothetical protein
MPSGHEDDRVKEDEPVGERCQRKSLRRHDENGYGDEDREHFHHPRSRLRRADERDDQESQTDRQEGGRLAGLP